MLGTKVLLFSSLLVEGTSSPGFAQKKFTGFKVNLQDLLEAYIQS